MTLLQPLFVAAAGLIVTWVGSEVPGANLDGTELAGLFAVGAASAAAAIAAASAVAAAEAPGPPQTLTYNSKTKSYEIGDA